MPLNHYVCSAHGVATARCCAKANFIAFKKETQFGTMPSGDVHLTAELSYSSAADAISFFAQIATIDWQARVDDEFGQHP